MPGETQDGMGCREFEAVLADALDGVLSAPAMEQFHKHAAECQNCGPLFASVQAGMHWLRSLEEVEPPRNLVRNILIATSAAPALQPGQRAPAAVSLADRFRGWLRPVFAPVLGTVAQPRFALTFAMAFFSISVVLNAAGVRITDVRHVDLRPSALRKNLVRGYYENSARVVRYYENIRFLQQFEAQVRELKEATKPEQPIEQEPPKNRKRDGNTSGQPTHENYSRDAGGDTLARGRAPQALDTSPQRVDSARAGVLDPTLVVHRRTA